MRLNSLADRFVNSQRPARRGGFWREEIPLTPLSRACPDAYREGVAPIAPL
jgi:hypothetical protein